MVKGIVLDFKTDKKTIKIVIAVKLFHNLYTPYIVKINIEYRVFNIYSLDLVDNIENLKEMIKDLKEEHYRPLTIDKNTILEWIKDIDESIYKKLLLAITLT